MNNFKAPIKQRLLNFLKENGIEQGVFAQKTKICESILRKKDSELSLDSIVRISTAYPEMNLDWLIKGIGLPNNIVNYKSINIEQILILKDELIKELREVTNSNSKLIATQEKYIVELENEKKEKRGYGVKNLNQ